MALPESTLWLHSLFEIGVGQSGLSTPSTDLRSGSKRLAWPNVLSFLSETVEVPLRVRILQMI